MKILRIIARLNIGGPARNAVLLTEGLSQSAKRKAHSVDNTLHPKPLPKGKRDVYWETVLMCGEVGKDEGDMGYLAREKGIEPVIVPELGRELSFRSDWRAFWKIYKIICRERPDIVHTHTAKAGALGRLAGVVYNVFNAIPCALCSMLRLHRAKRIAHSVILVHTFHGHVLHSYFGKIKTWFFIWVEKFLALFTDKIITVSEALKKELVEKFRIAPEGKFSVVELGFELDELLKLPLKEPEDMIKIGIVGRLVAVKNHKMLFEIANRIGHSAKRKIKFLVIGDGELRQELENYAKELGIEDIVEFKGWVKELRKIYEEMDILVLTSLNEGTPVSIIEAMAGARPVVAADVGGVADVVEDGRSGYLADVNDEEVFVKRILELVKNAEKRRSFGECGRGLARERFSKERLIKDMERVYRDLLNF